MDYEITTDGTTVWVNKAWMVGRFGRFGVDIHRDINQQATKGECLLCTHTTPPAQTGAEDWELFVTKMKELHGIDVPEEYRPERCRPFSTPCGACRRFDCAGCGEAVH
jgi:hypothetical protein